MPSRLRLSESEILAAVDGHVRRNEVLLDRLRERGVDTPDSVTADLHFFMPSAESASALAAHLRVRGQVRTEIGKPHAERGGEVSLTVVVEETVANLISRSYSEFLVRAAAAFGGEHDGWGTSVRSASSGQGRAAV